MTTPDDAARALLEEQAASLGGAVAAPAQTPEQVATGLAAAGGTATSVDADALLSQLQGLAAQVAELQAAKTAADAKAAPPPDKPATVDELTSALSGHPAGIVHVFRVIAQHLDAIEEHVGMRAKPATDSDE
jgi:ATP adenylyltransferase/5',5'''-P-1,P-4-tetraphosphate phosphorylase II